MKLHDEEADHDEAFIMKLHHENHDDYHDDFNANLLMHNMMKDLAILENPLGDNGSLRGIAWCTTGTMDGAPNIPRGQLGRSSFP